MRKSRFTEAQMSYGGELGRRYRVDHISTATATAAAKGSLIFMGVRTVPLPT
jgi:hypothetical protein